VKLSAYQFVYKGIDFDLPFRESIESLLGFCDEVVVGVEARSDDGTVEALELLKTLHGENLKLIVKEWNWDTPNPLGTFKNELRAECSGDWLFEVDSDEVFPENRGHVIKNFLALAPVRCFLVGVGLLPFFNGDHLKLSEPCRRPALSRREAELEHRSNDRLGCGYVLKGTSLAIKAERHLFRECQTAGEFKREMKRLDSVYLYHYSWYSLPRKWEMKNVRHYLELRLEGKLNSLADYKENKDHEWVGNFFGKPWHLDAEDYLGPVRVEMNDPNIVKFKVKHPKVMQEWLSRQRVYTFKRKRFLRLIG